MSDYASVQNAMNVQNAVNKWASQVQTEQQTRHTIENTQLQMQQTEMKHHEDNMKMVNEMQNSIYNQRQQQVQNRTKTQIKLTEQWTSCITGGGR